MKCGTIQENFACNLRCHSPSHALAVSNLPPESAYTHLQYCPWYHCFKNKLNNVQLELKLDTDNE